MCLATPIKIIELNGQKAKIKHDEHIHEVNTVLVPHAKVGDWIMAHGNLAINIMEEKEALELLELSKGHRY